MKSPWVVVHQDGLVNECTRCGMKMQLRLPVSASVYAAGVRAFLDEHQYCQPAAVTPEAVNEESNVR